MFQNLAYAEQLRHKQVSCATRSTSMTQRCDCDCVVGGPSRGIGISFHLSARGMERWSDGVEDQAAVKAS
jgi:hypothetical protein